MNCVKIKISYFVYLLLLISLFSGTFKVYFNFYLIVLFHEFCHIFAIKLMKGKIKKINITPIGCFIDISYLNIKKTYKVLVYFARHFRKFNFIYFFKKSNFNNI